MNRVFMLALLWLGPVVTAQQLELSQVEPLPDIEIDGAKVKIHTQGLYVTDRHYVVTGRLETVPKRALLMRFDRRDRSKYEYLDLTALSPKETELDHPGGFDRDDNGVFWIAVSTSHAAGPTIIYGVVVDEHRSLREGIQIRNSFRVDDHLGAIGCVENDLLLAANWDTKTIYLIRTNGKLVKKQNRNEFIKDKPDWQLAIQDWKFVREKGLLLAGGIDKGLAQNSKVSRAVIAWIDLKRGTAKVTRIEPRTDVLRPLTNEGLAWFQDELFLLPEDLGHGAKVLRFSVKSSVN